jgi:hypothetical protein
MAKQDLRDWVIMGHVGLAVNVMLGFMFLHPDPTIVAAVCTAVPTILGLYHWFCQRDDKLADAER